LKKSTPDAERSCGFLREAERQPGDRRF